jgi:hypothetical protein
MGFLTLLLFFAAIYFLPTIIALARGKQNAVAILALNLLLGWTFIGWVVSFVWSLTSDPVPVNVVTHPIQQFTQQFGPPPNAHVCPYCRSSIPAEASVCRYCQREVAAPPRQLT